MSRKHENDINDSRRFLVTKGWSAPAVISMSLPLHAQTSDATDTTENGGITPPVAACSPPNLALNLQGSSDTVMSPASVTYTITLTETNGCPTNGDDIIIVFAKDTRFDITGFSSSGLNFTDSASGPSSTTFTASGQTLAGNGTATITIDGTFTASGIGFTNFTAAVAPNDGAGDMDVSDTVSTVTLTWIV